MRYSSFAGRVGRLTACVLAICFSFAPMAHAQSASAASPPSYALLSSDPAWVTDIVLSAGPSASATVNLSQCCVPNSMTAPPNGVRRTLDAGRGPGIPGGAGFTLLNLGAVDPAAEVYVKASHVSGMRLYLPVFRDPLTTYGQTQTARGMVSASTPDDDRTRVWTYCAEGSKNGTVTIAVLDKNGVEIARDWHLIVPGRLDSFLLPAAIPDGGSVVDVSGFVTVGVGLPGANVPGSSPDGLTFVWYTQGLESGKSAPRVVVPH